MRQSSLSRSLVGFVARESYDRHSLGPQVSLLKQRLTAEKDARAISKATRPDHRPPSVQLGLNPTTCGASVPLPPSSIILHAHSLLCRGLRKPVAATVDGCSGHYCYSYWGSAGRQLEFYLKLHCWTFGGVSALREFQLACMTSKCMERRGGTHGTGHNHWWHLSR